MKVAQCRDNRIHVKNACQLFNTAYPTTEAGNSLKQLKNCKINFIAQLSQQWFYCVKNAVTAPAVLLLLCLQEAMNLTNLATQLFFSQTE